MKIVKLTVTDEAGVQHTWEGVEGFLHIRSFIYKGTPYQSAIDAHLTLPADPNVK